MNVQKFKLIPVLGALLGAQLLLALVLGLAGRDPGLSEEQSSLIAAEITAIDRILIEDSTDNVINLHRKDQQWQVAEAGSFPADDERIKKLLDSLSGLQAGWPVGTTEATAERFKVAPESFERKLVLYQQDKAVAELLVGNAAAFKKTYVRLSDKDEIYIGDFNAYEVYSRPDEWIEKEILQQDPAEIAAVRLPGLSLQRDEQGLHIGDLKSDQQTNAEQAEALLDKIANLKVQEVLGTEAKPDFGQNKHSISLTLKDGSAVDYTISQPKDQNYYVLKSSTRPEYFKIPTYTLDPIFNTKRDQLVEAKQPEAEENKAS